MALESYPRCAPAPLPCPCGPELHAHLAPWSRRRSRQVDCVALHGCSCAGGSWGHSRASLAGCRTASGRRPPYRGEPVSIACNLHGAFRCKWTTMCCARVLHRRGRVSCSRPSRRQLAPESARASSAGQGLLPVTASLLCSGCYTALSRLCTSSGLSQSRGRTACPSSPSAAS